MAGAIAMLGDCVATTEPAVEQTGQTCEGEGVAFRSAQKWNCAPRKMIPRSNAKMRILCALVRMFLIRRSLDGNGCGVKSHAMV